MTNTDTRGHRPLSCDTLRIMCLKEGETCSFPLAEVVNIRVKVHNLNKKAGTQVYKTYKRDKRVYVQHLTQIV